MEGYGYSADEYCVPEPYPPVQAVGKNRRYAEAMLDNVGGSNSEMSAVAVYVYDHLVTAELPEVADAFRGIGAVEMRHLEIFGTLARQMGEDPRLWGSGQGGTQELVVAGVQPVCPAAGSIDPRGGEGGEGGHPKVQGPAPLDRRPQHPGESAAHHRG